MDRAMERMLDTMRDERKAIARRIRVMLQKQLPAYRATRSAVLDAEIELEVEWTLAAVRSGRRPGGTGDAAQLTAVGEAQARRGVPVDEMLRAWRIGTDTVLGYARKLVDRFEFNETELLEHVQAALAWSDFAMMTTAEAHRETERMLAYAADDGELRRAFVSGTLHGTLLTTELRSRAALYGLDPAAEYFAIRARLGEAAALNAFENALGCHARARNRCGLTVVVDGIVVGFVRKRPPKNIDGAVGYGPAAPLDRLPESYRLAARALMTVEACGLGGAHDIPSLGLRGAVVTDTDIGEVLRARYLEPLRGSGSTRELVSTMRTYLDCGMSVEKAATELFVHKNTVRYRLARFEELTGANLRRTESLFEVWWALELSAMGL